MSKQEQTRDENDRKQFTANPDWSKDLYAASRRALEQALDKHADLYAGARLDPFNMASAYLEAMFSLWRDPAGLLEAQKNYFNDSIKLWHYAAERMLGKQTEPVISPGPDDRRWKDADWSENPVFDYLKQSYLLAARCTEQTVDSLSDLSAEDLRKLTFFTRQFVNALAPTNFPATNPQVMKATVTQKGQNLVAGVQNFIRDLEQGNGRLRIAMTDPAAFTLGENVAVSPGRIVYQNNLFQLIQYQPSTPEVYKRPLLIIPPWINKYYILDLQPKNSMVKWLVDQGHTVFMVSWANPDESFADVGFEDYMQDGVYAAVDMVARATAEEKINLVGFCIGGTLNAATLAHMHARGDRRIRSATFFASLIDFSEPGDLGVFIDDIQVGELEKKSGESGYLDGKLMSQTFNLLRSNDLIWSFYINNYLEGKDPAIFDLLYWNSDSTHLPAKMYSFYLRNMYLNNSFCQPGGVTLGKVPIDVRNIDVPCYFISTHDDHISPWESTYYGARLMSGPVRFVLGGSGHIAGIVNPPAAHKYYYLTGPARLPKHPDSWLKKAVRHDGSWWTDWHNWLTAKHHRRVAARIPGSGGLPVLEDAPGSYVRKRI
jgi:polyhydroxyalkanoate synthase